MKKVLKYLALPLFFVALFIYGAYSYFYELLWWNNLTIVFLNALLVGISCGACGAISQSLSEKNSKKNIALAMLGITIPVTGVFFALGFVVNNIIYNSPDPKHEKEAAFILSACIIVFLSILISLYARLFKNKKVFKAIVSIFLAIAMLASTLAMSLQYIDFSFLQPVYRFVAGVGGVDVEFDGLKCDGLKYTFAYSTEKIQPTDRLGKMDYIDIKLAKNEWESFQFVLATEKESEEVYLEVSEFMGTVGSSLPVNIYKEHYVECEYPENRLGHMYPDALIPIKSGEKITLTKDSTQAFFIETRSNKDTEADVYKANLVLRNSDGEIVLNKLIGATVWDFTLPETHYTETAIGVWNDKIGDNYKKYYDYVLDHGISPYNLPYDILDERADAYMSDPRVTTFTIPFYGDDETLVKAYEKIQSNPEWARKGYFYPIDEPSNKEHFDNYNMIVERLERLCPGYNMVTPFNNLNTPDGTNINPYELQKNNNTILCPLSSCHKNDGFHEDIQTLADMGKRSWWYVCCDPDTDEGYNNMFTYQDGINHRALFWQQYDYDVTGLLYWNIAYWQKCGNPWTNAKTWDSWEDAGDGMWLYPGEEIGVDGPVGSLRIKNVCAGLEDYDYLRLAEEKFGKEWVDEQVAKITKSLTNSISDAELFEEIRRTIGDKLNGNN